MLIQITNRCQEGCAHCMQNSLPDSPHMDINTFKKSLQFASFLNTQVYIITGGEPTEHPQFFEFCKLLDNHIRKSKQKACFMVTSNGTWYPALKDEVERLSKLKSYMGMQVYTNPKWYKDADFIIEHRNGLQRIPKVILDSSDIRSMQDLGRARFNEQAQAEIDSSPYYMSCLNGHLMFIQASPMYRLKGLVRPGLLCRPLVDFNGDVHLSESWLCPSFGNVNTDMMTTIFSNLQHSKPCCKCKLGRKFLASAEPKIIQAKGIIGIDNEQDHIF